MTKKVVFFLLVPVGTCWYLWVLVGTCWYLLAPVGTCWHVLVPVGVIYHEPKILRKFSRQKSYFRYFFFSGWKNCGVDWY